MASEPTPEDPFTILLTLEDTLYTAAYRTGLVAGAKAGKVEGRIFGLQQGFEKFAALGTLHGRSVVWGARLLGAQAPKNVEKKVTCLEGNTNETDTGQAIKNGSILPLLPPLLRLPTHITFLYSLTDLLTFSTTNTEDAVADLDDRFKRGASKAKLIELLTKESSSFVALTTFASLGVPSRRGVKIVGEGKGVEDNMEDFGGSRLVM